ncbi:hypothetical protein [Soonwooa sp.]|uniref:hypothetical protein n=1 Tax=Soonwooa sp. TaxID=1938592 RepID=UPI0026087E8F|nr:hypothetical protein [Soonwooa sp.]
MYKNFKFLLGIALGLFSIISLLSSSFVSFVLILSSALLVFPPTWEMIKPKAGFRKNRVLRILLAGLMYVVGATNFVSNKIDKNKSEKATIAESSNQNAPQTSTETAASGGTVKYDENGNKASSANSESTSSYKGLKSVNPADIYLNFQDKGFTIDKQISTDGSFFYCTKEYGGIKYDVTIYAEDNVNEVTEIKLNAYRNQANLNSVEDMKPFLKYAVSIPYDGADVEKVQNYIDKNYNKNKASITVSGVKFTIYCPSKFVRLVTVENE